MNILTQMKLFDESIFDNLGDLERLQLVINSLDDEPLIRKLYQIRGKGRNDWPCEAMWNSFIASFLFEHKTVSSLLREMARNSQLRAVCGFEPKGKRQKDGTVKLLLVPSKSAYSKFLKNLMKCQDELNDIFKGLVQYMYDHLDGFGDILMVDGKAIQSFGTKLSENKKSGNRGEHDADWCRKTYSVNGFNGESIIKSIKWFGFRLHLIADASYELPVTFAVTKASNSEHKETRNLLNKTNERMLKKCKYFLADKGYDSTELINLLKEKEISPIIDIRNLWKDGEETHQYKNTNLVYNYKGDVWYVNDKGGKIELVCKGYDKSTNSMRYGFKPQEQDNRIFRIDRKSVV